MLSLWFGCGLVPYAPGTAGTIGALPLYFLVRAGGPIAVAICAVVVTAIGVWAADTFAAESGVHDPQQVVIDEVAGVLIPLAAAPFTARGVCVAVALFRLFDQFKPWPGRLVERKWSGGWGIVFDDIVAGIWALAVVVVLRNISLL